MINDQHQWSKLAQIRYSVAGQCENILSFQIPGLSFSAVNSFFYGFSLEQTAANTAFVCSGSLRSPNAFDSIRFEFMVAINKMSHVFLSISSLVWPDQWNRMSLWSALENILVGIHKFYQLDRHLTGSVEKVVISLESTTLSNWRRSGNQPGFLIL